MTFLLYCQKEKERTIIKGSGTIEVKEIQISPIVFSRILEIHKVEGESFTKGDVLVTLTSEEIQANYESGIVMIQSAKKKLEQLMIEYQQLIKDKKRAMKLYSSGSISKQELDQIITKEGSLRKVIESTELEIKRLEELQRIAKYRLKETKLIAPIDGIVLKQNFEIGEVVMPGSSILSIANLDKIYLEVYLPLNQMAKLKLNDKAKIKVEGIDKIYEGKVVYISDKAEFTPKNIQTESARERLMFRIKLEIQNSEHLLKPGLPADAFFDQM
jgi:HlyD family secretion protein